MLGRDMAPPQAELDHILKDYVGRESPLYHAERLSEYYRRCVEGAGGGQGGAAHMPWPSPWPATWAQAGGPASVLLRPRVMAAELVCFSNLKLGSWRGQPVAAGLRQRAPSYSSNLHS